MPRLAFILAIFSCVFGAVGAQAAVVITVDKTAQRLSVSVDGVHRYEWPVSTARMGYNTPNGTYRPERLARTWYSSKYDWSPMPYSIFFHGGYAIHGSYEVSRLGRPASHGCIRLHPANAAILFHLVQENVGNTRIVVVGDRAGPEPQARWHPEPTRHAYAEPKKHPRPHQHARAERHPVSAHGRHVGADFGEVFESNAGDLSRPRY